MSAYYIDTSAAVKVYAQEAGSDWIRTQVSPPPVPLVISSQLLRVEMWSAFARRTREGTVTPTEYRDMRQLFSTHCSSRYRLVALREAIIQLACDLIEQYPLRGCDAVHLATALTAHRQLVAHRRPGLVFLSADDRLNHAAAAEGMIVDNPNRH